MIKVPKKHSLKNLFLFSTIMILAIFTRFYKITSIPTFIYQDEMGYLISAISLNNSGSDIVGTWNPFSLSPVSPSIAALDELTTQFIYPFYKLPINNVLAGKLPFILLSLIIPFFIAGISYQLTMSKTVKNWSWFIAMFNPWIWQVGRMSVDPYVSFSFYIIGAYLILKLKNWQKLWSLPALFFGFYHYQGHKLVFIFWVLIFTLYSIAKQINLDFHPAKTIKNLKNKKILPSLFVFFASLLLFIAYVFIQLPSQQSNQRLNSLYLPSSSEITNIVNDERRLSIKSKLNTKITNRYTLWTRKIWQRYTKTYSFEYLFQEGQGGNAPFSVWNHGLFYSVEAVLIFLGFAYLLNKKRFKLLLLLLFGLIITVIPSLISNNEAYFYRSSLNIPILIIIAAIGIKYLKELLPNRLFFLIPLIYIFSISNFAYIYFYRFPIISSERQYFSDRILTEYLRRLDQNQKAIIVLPELEFSVETYLFYTDYINKNNISNIQEMFQNKQFQIENIAFTNTCIPENINQANETVISRWDIRKCDNNENNIFDFNSDKEYFSNPLQIKNIKDSGTVFNIYNDQLCEGLEINPYININSYDNFDFTNMNDQEFCQTWITKSLEQ